MRILDLSGKLVRLVPINYETDMKVIAQTGLDSEFQNLANTNIARVFDESDVKKWYEEEFSQYTFIIRTLADDRMIGDLGLGGVNWTSGDAWLGIGIGDREYWGKGYGTDAMWQLLRFGFEQLNLRRITLNTFEYNPRGIRCYEKVGFRHEGRERGYLNRFGRRWDLVYMGVLREEWEATPPPVPPQTS
jgi:RimJ/RimL family protein N-acetyltransferase